MDETTDPKKVIQQKIKELEDQLEGYRVALQALHSADAKSGAEGMRFYKKRPLEASKILLTERGRMKREDLEEALMAGGIAIDRKRARHNVRISIDLALTNGSLVKRGGYIDLPKEPR